MILQPAAACCRLTRRGRARRRRASRSRPVPASHPRGLSTTDPEALAADPVVEEAVAAAIAAVNAEFSRAEGIKRWRILPRDFMQELDEITPTLKVRRRAIIQKYGEDIESLYA